MIKIFLTFSTLVFYTWSFFSNPRPAEGNDGEIPMCQPVTAILRPSAAVPVPELSASQVFFDFDTAKAYAMPLLTPAPDGRLLLSWTERDEQGYTAFCMAYSKDNGQSFSDKKTIFKGAGMGSSRLFRAKVLPRKDGSLFAVFSNRPDAQPVPGFQQQGRGRGGRSELVYCTSKDDGQTWSVPQAVDTDPDKTLMRGFFDAVVLPNDEIAVVYLKDVKGSTKHEERDLRISITENGVFQAEKRIDPVVCDCCNISLLVDANGNLNIYYRDNNDDIRDISVITSSDNGATFSSPRTVYPDNWKISGCPHNGAVSVAHGNSALVSWYSGAESAPGLRLTTQDGQNLMIIEEPSAKNHTLLSSGQQSVMLWEQNIPGGDRPQLVFRKINGATVSATTAIQNTENAANATGWVSGNNLLVVHEIKQNNRKNTLRISNISL